MIIAIASSPEDIKACYALRREIFMGEQGFQSHEEFDAIDDTCIHVLMKLGGTPTGCARLIRDGGIGKIGRVCVLKSHRGQGLGAALIRFGLEHFSALPGVTTAYLSAQVQAEPFYTSLGFVAKGETYLDGHVPHIDMTKAL